MTWTLRPGVSLHPMPFGGAFVLDDARLAARQIGSELAALLAGTATTPTGVGDPRTGRAGESPELAAELSLGAEEGWLIHKEETG